MKKLILFSVFCTLTLVAKAQYPQTLPIDYSSFLSDGAINLDGTDLIRETYTGFLPNEWIGSPTTSSGFNVQQNSTLSYSDYADNTLGKAIVTTTTRNHAFYVLTNNYVYSGKAFYLSTLINISSFRSGDAFLIFGQQYSGTFGRGKVVAVTNGIGYSLGVQFNNETPVAGSTVLNLNQTYLVVVKITPSETDPETISVFVNPVIGDNEPVTPEATTTSGTSPQLKHIQGIDLRATISCTMAGMRFSDNWSDVVQGGGLLTSINDVKTGSDIVSVQGKTIFVTEVGKIQIYNLQGKMLVEANNVSQLVTNLDKGIYIVRFTNEKGQTIIRKVLL